ncbi:unnamed protein product [Larinioides sclopetarius]|uniref:Uncharacterized protein n=1 Tax=Larinioides sclopetarius TaxID=280406 RepID=A0AAV2B376_9ARAC
MPEFLSLKLHVYQLDLPVPGLAFSESVGEARSLDQESSATCISKASSINFIIKLDKQF